MKPEPTIPQKIAAISDLEELEGALEQWTKEGRADARTKNLIAIRRLEIRQRAARNT